MSFPAILGPSARGIPNLGGKVPFPKNPFLGGQGPCGGGPFWGCGGQRSLWGLFGQLGSFGARGFHPPKFFFHLFNFFFPKGAGVVGQGQRFRAFGLRAPLGEAVGCGRNLKPLSHLGAPRTARHLLGRSIGLFLGAQRGRFGKGSFGSFLAGNLVLGAHSGSPKGWHVSGFSPNPLIGRILVFPPHKAAVGVLPPVTRTDFSPFGDCWGQLCVRVSPWVAPGGFGVCASDLGGVTSMVWGQHGGLAPPPGVS